MPSRTSKNTTQKGLGYDYRVHRARLLTRHVDGTPCWWCGRPMYRDRRKNWDYNPHAMRKDGKPDTASGVLSPDHELARSQGGTNANVTRLLHLTCNKQRGTGTRDDQRPALTHTHRPEDTQLGYRVFDWP